MVILEAPYFDGYETYPRDFVNWMNGMEQFFKQENFADNKKVRYAKLKLRGKAQRFWRILNISVIWIMNLPLVCVGRYERKTL